tara:strand:- start:473 stop:1075 length:603 start_codon:yes stop_codon:yes gene_type:complete
MAKTFWSQASTEPKRSFRWLLYLSGMPQFIVTKVKKPGFSVGNSTHAFLNYEFKYPGRVTWQPVNFTIVDPVQPDSTQSLYNILQQAGYKLPNEYTEDSASTISKGKMVESLGTQIKLVQLEHDGTPLETWTLNNPQITSVDFGDLDYSAETMINITVNLQYDWASLETAGGPDDNTWQLNPLSQLQPRGATPFINDDAG